MFAIAPVEVAVNALAARLVIGIVRITEAEPFEWTEMGLDGVEPTGIGGSGHESDVVFPRELSETLVSVGGEVVENEVNAYLFGIASA